MSTPKKFGPYTVEREIGRGGMGVVYQARDPRLDRVVAIKVLPAELARDPERLARFEREARLLASLNQPNIGGIFGLEQAEDGTHFLVLEFLDGPTLQDRLTRGPMGVDEAVDTFRQFAAALETANESGVIDRDLKPANIKLTTDGVVKVLDFGLAKDTVAAGDPQLDITNSPTVAAHTMAGMILGTAAYMSPEQARGKPLDRRTDIFSFGCVFYEALTGRALFGGETASDTIARILEREPDWGTLPGDIPDRVRRIIQRCLEKDSRKRQRDIGDVRLALEEIEETRVSSMRAARASGDLSAAAATATAATSRPRSSAVPWTVAVIALLAAVGAFLLPALRSTPAPGDLVRFTLGEPPEGRFFGRGFLSPDGTTLACSGRGADGAWGILLRDLDTLEFRHIPAQGGDLFWSPDGKSIGLFGQKKLQVVSLASRESRTVCDAPSNRGGSWGAEFIVFAGAQGPLYKVSTGGGTPEPVTTLDESRGETAHRCPYFLPDGETFLYVALPGKGRLLTVYAGHVDGRAPTAITTALTSPVYTEPGYLLFQRGRKIVAQAFDAKTLTTSGEPIAVDDAPALSEGVGTPALSASVAGHLAFRTPEDLRTQLVWLDSATGEELETLDVQADDYDPPRISPDGRHVAIVRNASPEESDIWILELERLVMTRFTQGPGNNADPIWSPDGAYLAYKANADGPWNLYKKPFTSGGPPEPLVVSPAPFKNPFDWSPDGKYLLYEQLGEGTNMDLWIAPTDGSGEPRAYVTEVHQERQARFSPDGRWVAYMIQDSGFHVLVNSFPVPSQPHRVSLANGFEPRWQANGKAIYFTAFDEGRGMLMRAPFQAEPLRTGIPEMIFEFPENTRGDTRSAYDNRILALRAVAPPQDNTLTVVLNWTRLLEKADR